jgi:hypothetical protein
LVHGGARRPAGDEVGLLLLLFTLLLLLITLSD